MTHNEIRTVSDEMCQSRNDHENDKYALLLYISLYLNDKKLRLCKVKVTIDLK